MQLTFTLAEIATAAEKVYDIGKGRKVWAFRADMGAGKTTFIHSLCEYLGVTSSIGSPTYSIINEYHTDVGTTIYHMDWYRLRDEEEALQAGVEDTLLSGKMCLVEWPERAAGLLPDDCLHLKIEVIDETHRKISVE